MKEIQVNQFQSSISFPILINTGVYYFEFGYRKRNGDWRMLAYQNLNLGYRIKRKYPRFDQDEWFMTEKSSDMKESGIHEESYQLSLNTHLGGSETILN